jgi:hypothetical protein
MPFQPSLMLFKSVTVDAGIVCRLGQEPTLVWMTTKNRVGTSLSYKHKTTMERLIARYKHSNLLRSFVSK